MQTSAKGVFATGDGIDWQCMVVEKPSVDEELEGLGEV